MATQASAITFLSTPGQAYVDGMRFVQFYFGLPVAMVILSITAVPIYHRLKVYTAYEYPGAALRPEKPRPGEHPVPHPARARGRVHDPRPGPDHLRHPRLGFPADDLPDGRPGDPLHGAGGTEAVTKTHLLQMMHHHGGDGRRPCSWSSSACRPTSLFERPPRGRKAREAERRQFRLRLEGPYNFWSGLIGGGLRGPVLFRDGPVPGPAVSDRAVDRPEPHGAPGQRRPQGPDAVHHPVHRGHDLRLLPVRHAAAVFQPGRDRPGQEQRLRRSAIRGWKRTTRG